MSLGTLFACTYVKPNLYSTAVAQDKINEADAIKGLFSSTKSNFDALDI